MRALLLTAIIFSFLPLIVRRPYIGILVWSWLGYMNPHKLTYGFGPSMSFALMVALATFIGMLCSKEPKRIPWTRETVLLAILVAWMFMTTMFSLYPWGAWEQWDKVWRIMLMTYVTMMLINDEHRLKLLVYVIALSLGFFGFKGGIFVVQTGGAHAVLGPPDSFIGDRNSVGLALIMTVPLIHYMQLQMTQWYWRHALMVGTGLTLIAIIGTQSRGALVGVCAMLSFYLMKTRRKFAGLLAVIPLAVVIYLVMPPEWFARMETIQTWEEDGSASERVRAWHNAIDLANSRFIGGGMRALVYWGERDSHSIYFGMLAENGWVGLFMFLLLILFTWRSASWVIAHTKQHPDLLWVRDLAAMMQVSLIGYMSAGAFLGLQYFDLFYHLIAIVVMTRMEVSERLEKKAMQVAEKARAPVPSGLRPVRRALGGPT